MRPEGKVALVTGGTRSIGRGISLALARGGAKVAMNYVNDDEAVLFLVSDSGCCINGQTIHLSGGQIMP